MFRFSVVCSIDEPLRRSGAWPLTAIDHGEMEDGVCTYLPI